MAFRLINRRYKIWQLVKPSNPKGVIYLVNGEQVESGSEESTLEVFAQLGPSSNAVRSLTHRYRYIPEGNVTYTNDMYIYANIDKITYKSWNGGDDGSTTYQVTWYLYVTTREGFDVRFAHKYNYHDEDGDGWYCDTEETFYLPFNELVRTGVYQTLSSSYSGRLLTKTVSYTINDVMGVSFKKGKISLASAIRLATYPYDSIGDSTSFKAAYIKYGDGLETTYNGNATTSQFISHTHHIAESLESI